MSPTTIEWTDESWNPATGCTKVSPGCDHCYAEAITNRFGGPGTFDKVVLHPERLEKPLHWRKPRRVFVNSMSDLFHAEVSRYFIAQVFAVMALTPQHTYQILTKRPGRMRSVLTLSAFALDFNSAITTRIGEAAPPHSTWPLPNVWLGTSVEDQERADKRIPVLLDTPAAVRFLSCEPLLGPVDLTRLTPGLADARDTLRGGFRDSDDWLYETGDYPKLDWVIVGGESGPKARPMDVAWARSLVEQCRAAGVPVFVKQLGNRPGHVEDGHQWLRLSVSAKGGKPEEWPQDLRVREMPERMP